MLNIPFSVHAPLYLIDTLTSTVGAPWAAAARPTAPVRRGARPSFTGRVEAVRAQLRVWLQRARERAELATLDERMLRDIGITRVDVSNECSKPFWRA